MSDIIFKAGRIMKSIRRVNESVNAFLPRKKRKGGDKKMVFDILGFGTPPKRKRRTTRTRKKKPTRNAKKEFISVGTGSSSVVGLLKFKGVPSKDIKTRKVGKKTFAIFVRKGRSLTKARRIIK